MPSICESAIALFKAGKPEEAETLLKTDESQAAQVLLREYYLGESRRTDAIPIIQSLAQGDSAESLVSQSILRFFEHSLQQAIALAKQALQMDSSLATASNHLGRALQNDGQSVKASKAFKAALKSKPDYAQAWHNLALTRRAIGAMDEAISMYQKAIEQEPKYQSAWLNLGLSYASVERHAEALEAFESLLKINAKNEDALLNAGLACHALGGFDEAIAYYDKCISINPKLALAYSYKGILLNELQRTEQSLTLLEQAIALDPNDINAWCELGNVHEKLNDLAAAAKANSKALAIDPYYPIALVDAARIAKRNKDINAAMGYLNTVNVNQLPYRSALEYSFEHADVLDKAGQYQHAFEAFQQANKLASQSPRYQQVDQTALAQNLKNISVGLAKQVVPAPEKKGLLAKLFGNNKTQPIEMKPELGSKLCFLIGFPRSGTTLLDTMISASDSVMAIEEKATIEKVITSLKDQGVDYWDESARQEVNWESMRELYFATVSEQLKLARNELDEKVIVDKLPFRFIDAFFIKLLFPHAKFLFVQRQPADVILSNFMQNFVPNETFVHFHSLESSVDVYDKSMQLWYQIQPHLGQSLLQISYENLITQGQQTLQTICDFLSIEYSPNMLDTKSRLATRDRISTNSYAQVSQDLYTASLSRWQHYEDAFQSHLTTLMRHQEKLGY